MNPTRTLATLALATLPLLATLPAGAEAPWDEPLKEAACEVADDEARITFFWNKAWPGEVVPANAFNLHNDPVKLYTCIPSGGSVTFHNIDTLLGHDPVTRKDIFYENMCFWASKTLGHTLGLNEEWTLRFTYDAEEQIVRVSRDDGATWTDCDRAADTTHPGWAEIVWFSYLRESANGVILVKP